jgi:hypothetical protein
MPKKQKSIPELFAEKFKENLTQAYLSGQEFSAFKTVFASTFTNFVQTANDHTANVVQIFDQYSEAEAAAHATVKKMFYGFETSQETTKQMGKGRAKAFIEDWAKYYVPFRKTELAKEGVTTDTIITGLFNKEASPAELDALKVESRYHELSSFGLATELEQAVKKVIHDTYHGDFRRHVEARVKWKPLKSVAVQREAHRKNYEALFGYPLPGLK